MHSSVYICRARSRPARHSARLFPFLYSNVDINPSIYFSPARLTRRYFHARSTGVFNFYFSTTILIVFCFVVSFGVIFTIFFGCKRPERRRLVVCRPASLPARRLRHRPSHYVHAVAAAAAASIRHTDNKTIKRHVGIRPGGRTKSDTLYNNTVRRGVGTRVTWTGGGAIKIEFSSVG